MVRPHRLTQIFNVPCNFLLNRPATTLTLRNAAAVTQYAELAGRRRAGADRARLRNNPPALRQASDSRSLKKAGNTLPDLLGTR